MVAGMFLVMVVSRATFGAGRWEFQAVVKRPSARELAGLAAALAIGMGWLVAKPYHALNHLHFMACHLFLFQLLGYLIIARAVSIQFSPAFAGMSGPGQTSTCAEPGDWKESVAIEETAAIED